MRTVPRRRGGWRPQAGGLRPFKCRLPATDARLTYDVADLKRATLCNIQFVYDTIYLNSRFGDPPFFPWQSLQSFVALVTDLVCRALLCAAALADICLPHLTVSRGRP